MPIYNAGMEHTSMHHNRDNDVSDTSQLAAAIDGQYWETEFEPTADSLTETAYFLYIDHGSVPGQDMRNWLDLEALMLKESQLDRRISLRD
ncbi:hypothetical protein [Phenylobacterium sp.]|uniref:hypothetical protein n=1 Tax=Phenylobacterium sp. TaxID=1871053 RepID=UPI00286DDD2F|nr:hypothetical protein [Phenylobacterium sp.]